MGPTHATQYSSIGFEYTERTEVLRDDTVLRCELKRLPLGNYERELTSRQLTTATKHYRPSEIQIWTAIQKPRSKSRSLLSR